MNHKKHTSWLLLSLLSLVALTLQGCFGIGDSNTQGGTNVTTNSNGNQVSVAQNLFKGKIYLTIDHNLWVITGDNKATELLKGNDIYDPAVSPDGKLIVFVVRYKNYSNIAYMPVTASAGTRLLDGDGHFYIDSGFPKDTYHWYVQPAWSPDGSHLLFLSDLQKDFVWYGLNSLFSNNYFLDLQVFSIPLNNPTQKPQALAYASFGDGGDRDASYRPGSHGNTQDIVYTHYAYDAKTGTQQVIQIFLADANAIANHPGVYTPLLDSGVPLTPPAAENLEPAFSPDGNALAYIRRESANQMGLYVMSVSDGVTTNPNDPKSQQQALLPYAKSSHILSNLYVSNPVWSPDGKQIAYLQYSGNEFDLWLANVKYDAQKGTYSLQGSPVQVTTGGIDGSSRPFWTK